MLNDNMEDKKLINLFIIKLIKGLKDNLSWLDEAYGRAERLVKFDARHRRIYIPAIYSLDNQYLDLSPNSQLGNYSFFWISDPQEFNSDRNMGISVKCPFSLIFWFDFRKIFKNVDIRDKESIKYEILNVLNKKIFLINGYFKINYIYELAENIFKEFSLDEVENQFLMHPFGGFRFDGIMCIWEKCIN